MQGREPGINKSPEIGADGFTAFPVGDAKVAHGVFGKAVEAFPESLVVDLFPHIEQPLRRLLPGEGHLHCPSPNFGKFAQRLERLSKAELL
jgi:hypothetical protein